MIGIYKITNNKNGKSYIGQSNHIKRRWKDHRTRAFQSTSNQYNSHLYRAIREYGLDSFSFKVLEECPLEQLDEREKYYVQFYDTYKNGYNLTEGGDSGTSSILSREQVDEIVELLQTSSLSHREIAEDYGVSTATISGINCGYNWHNDELTYPIRDGDKVRYVNGEQYSPNEAKVKSKITKLSYTNCSVSRIHKYKPMKKYSCSCGNLITKKDGLCVSCARIKARVVERPSIDIIIEQVATIGFEATGRIYGVSGNSVKKWLKVAGKPYLLNEVKQLYGNYKPPKEKRVVEKYEGYIVVSKNGSKIITFLGLQNVIDYIILEKLTSADRNRISEGVRRVLNGKRDTYLGLSFEYCWDIA